MRVAVRHETETEVTYTFAEVNDPDVSVLTVYKTEPASYRHVPSALTGPSIGTWQSMVSMIDDTAGVIWSEE